MNAFDTLLEKTECQQLFSQEVDTFQVNVGFLCNQQCSHCHHEASPDRTEIMSWEVMEKIIDAAEKIDIRTFDITGGAPELNPHFKRFITELRNRDYHVMVRSNLTAMTEPGMEDIPGFYRDHEVEIIASMPCYLKENVCAQRGEGVYDRSVSVMKKLNTLGYGTDPDLRLNLVYNPGGPFLPPDETYLEGEYKRELAERFGIQFNRLFTITNMPLGRFMEKLHTENQDTHYLDLLTNSFNSTTVENLMCRHQICISWDGTLFDCDFNMALGLSVGYDAPDMIQDFDIDRLNNRRIITGNHCLGCTAGKGSSCGGALVE